MEPGAVGASRVNIERDPASAGNAVVLGQKKHRESTATLSFSPDNKLIEGKKATNACYCHLRRVVNRFILGGTEPLPFGFDVSATAEVARSCCRLTAVVVVSRLSRRALTGSHKEWSPASLTLLAKQTLTNPPLILEHGFFSKSGKDRRGDLRSCVQSQEQSHRRNGRPQENQTRDVSS